MVHKVVVDHQWALLNLLSQGPIHHLAPWFQQLDCRSPDAEGLGLVNSAISVLLEAKKLTAYKVCHYTWKAYFFGARLGNYISESTLWEESCLCSGLEQSFGSEYLQGSDLKPSHLFERPPFQIASYKHIRDILLPG